MDRRKFIRNGSLTGIGLTTVGSWSRIGAGVVGNTVPEKVASLNLEEITVLELQKCGNYMWKLICQFTELK